RRDAAREIFPGARHLGWPERVRATATPVSDTEVRACAGTERQARTGTLFRDRSLGRPRGFLRDVLGLRRHLHGGCMTLTKEAKQEIFGKHGHHGTDTGSTEVQVALLSTRITELTEHMRAHPKDHHSRRGLLKLVGRRRRLLDYLQRTNVEGYRALIKELGLRREERMYAAGKIPGGFFKREGRPTERAILTARMIDRPIRPLWPKGYRNEVQVICTTLSADLVTPHDILCINGASAALMISPLPFLGPVGAVRVGRIDDQWVINPTLQEMEEPSNTLDLIVVGTPEALTMVEAGAAEIAEDKLLEALELAPYRIRK